MTPVFPSAPHSGVMTLPPHCHEMIALQPVWGDRRQHALPRARGYAMVSIAIGQARRRPLAVRYHLGKLAKYRYLPQYIWYHKLRFGVDKTKFDISFCVFIESFINDQYGIRAFLSKLRTAREVCFIDIGRNHGLVFYYAMYHIMKHDLPVKVVNYYGIDPSPLKFVYFNFHDLYLYL